MITRKRKMKERGPTGLVVLHVTIAAETFEPVVLADAGHLLDEDALNLIARFVERLDAGVFAVLGVEQIAALGQQDGLGGFAFLEGEDRRAEFRLKIGAVVPVPIAAL